MMETVFKISLSFGFTILLITTATAQGVPPTTPIDGGLSLLLAAGGIYGLKKLKDHKSGT